MYIYETDILTFTQRTPPRPPPAPKTAASERYKFT